MFSLTDLSLADQISTLSYGRAPKADLQELARHLSTTCPDRIAFAEKQLGILGQCPEFYEHWKNTLRAWKKALRLSSPDYNIYIIGNQRR